MGLHTGFFLSFFFSSPPLCFDLQLRRKVQHCWRQSQDVKLSVTSGVSPTSETETASLTWAFIVLGIPYH